LSLSTPATTTAASVLLVSVCVGLLDDPPSQHE
jgi:hypothetical protein